MALVSAYATICERVLVERDNVPTLIRLVDIFFIPPETPKTVDGEFPAVAMTLYVNIRLTPDDEEEHDLSFTLVRPDGSSVPQELFSRQKTGSPTVPGSMGSFNLALQLGVNPTHHGNHEFQIFFDGERVATTAVFISRSDASSKPN